MKTLFVLMSFLSATLARADMKDYEGGWAGEFTAPFEFEIFLDQTSDTANLLKITHGSATLVNSYEKSGSRIHWQFGEELYFDGYKDATGVHGFVQSGFHQYHLELIPQKLPGIFVGTWRPFFVSSMDKRVLLSIENCDGETYDAYLILGDSRAPQLMCGNFQKSGDTLNFQDYRTGIQFRAVLLQDEIQLVFVLGGIDTDTLSLRKTTENFSPQAPQHISNVVANDGWETAKPTERSFDTTYFARLADSIHAGVITNTHSVLVACNGKLIHEAYLDGWDATSVHDLRSAQKTFTGAAVGVAIERGLFKSVKTPLYDHLPESHQGTKESDPRKAQITLHHLLTMSSGIDAVDFGTDRTSPASEDAYQQTGNWSYAIADAPMLHDPGTHANYGSANACLTGIMLNSVTGGKPQIFMDDALYRPLGITNYVLQTDFEGTTYGAGGMFMTPRDMLKIGQLYLNGGTWNGRNVLPKSWIEASWKQHTTLDNSEKHEGYGYFWWQRTYSINGKEILSHEARGAGGQYIFVIPEYELVIAVTSGNYRNGRYWQPEKIVEQYILPAMAHK